MKLQGSQLVHNSGKTEVKLKRKQKLTNKAIDQDFLMYNSPEDEKQLRDYVLDNYLGTIRNIFD